MDPRRRVTTAPGRGAAPTSSRSLPLGAAGAIGAAGASRATGRTGATGRELGVRLGLLTALAGLLLLATAGCTLLPLGGSVEPLSVHARVAGRPELTEYRAVVHCHSRLSHDSDGRFGEIARAARRHHFDAVFLTDHYAPGNIARSPRGRIDSVLFVPGVELRHPAGGSLLALGVKEDFDERQPFDDLLADLRRQGALLAAGHVEKLGPDSTLRSLEGFEVYNLHREFVAASRWAIALRFLFFPADAFFEAAMAPPAANLERWSRALASGVHLVPLCGHDAHANIRLFGPLGGTVGTYSEVFRLVSTRILARQPSEAALLEALRAGRAHVVFDVLGDSAGFSLRIESPARPRRPPVVEGEAVEAAPGQVLRVLVPEPADIRLFRLGPGGPEERRARGRELRRWDPRPGVWRAEVWREGRIWIVSGAITVREPDAGRLPERAQRSRTSR